MEEKLNADEKSALSALHKQKGITQKDWESKVIAEAGRLELAEFATEQLQVKNTKSKSPGLGAAGSSKPQIK